MSNSTDNDERHDIDRTDELPVLLETVVLDPADQRLPPADTLEDTSEHTARYQAFPVVEAAELDELKNDLAARGAKIAALETDIARLGARWGDVEKHLSAKDAEIAALQRTVDDVGAALAERRDAEQKVHVELATRDAAAARLRDELAALRNATAAPSNVAALEVELRSARDIATGLRSELAAAKTAAAQPADTPALRERVAALEADVAARRRATTELEARANGLAARAAALEDRSRIAAEAQKRAESVAATEIARAKALRAELVKQARLVESLGRDLTMRRAAEAEPQHTTLALRAELATAQEAAAQAAAKLTAARAAQTTAIEALEKRHAAERAALEAEIVAAKHETLDAPNVALPPPAFEVIAQLEAEVEFKRQQVNAQLVALRERDQRLAEVEQALERGRAEATTARTEVDQLRADAARLERTLIDRDRAVEAKDARIAALQDELNQRLGAVQKLNAMDLSLQGLDSRMSKRLQPNDKPPVDNLNTPALVCLTGDAPKQFALLKAAVVIGRGAHCDVQVLTHFVSREHARITVVRGNATIEDLGSTNGVFVNSVRIDRHELRQGDLITIGETQFRFLESMAH